MLRIISLGLGVQSTALYFMSCMGILPLADHAVFADTGRESALTYQYLQFLQDWQKKHSGVPITVCSDKNLYQDLLTPGDGRRFVSIPAFTDNGDGTTGMLRRQCTNDYKIKVVNDFIRDSIYNLPKGARRPQTALWQGITTDEIERMSHPREAWKLNTYPFLGYYTDHNGGIFPMEWAKPMDRQDLVRWYVLNGLPLPPKSSCVFCPYQSDAAWEYRKKFMPEDFQAAVRVDEAIRNSTPKGITHPVFLHRSCRPLAEVEFDSSDCQDTAECSGTCHL